MNTTAPTIPHKQSPMRAIVEIINGELRIQAIADSDVEERRILDGLRFVREAWNER